MPVLILPAIDQSVCSGWTEQDREIYNKLPYYLTKMQLNYMKTWSIWPKLVGKKKWEPNMGPIMRAVSKEPSPNVRQFAFPNPVCDAPKKDIVDVRERSVDAIVYRHRFESLVLNFCPSFRDFLTDHVTFCTKDITEKITRFNDLFIRGYIFHYSPYVFLPNAEAGTELVACPEGGIPTASRVDGITTLTGLGKTTAWLTGNLPKLGNPGNLSLNAINLALNTLETDMRIPPFEGSGTPKGDNSMLNGKYCLVTSGEAWNQFIYDPWLLKYKNIELDVVKEGFNGSLFGRVTCKLEDEPIRILADGTFPDPEVRVVNPAAFNYGESVPNPDYVNAPYEVAYLVGGSQGYKAIEVGPPPKDFAGRGMPDGFGKMFWNGELQITKNILTECFDGDGNKIFDTNKYGEYLQIISQCTFGCVGEQRRSIIPIIFKRQRGANNPV